MGVGVEMGIPRQRWIGRDGDRQRWVERDGGTGSVCTVQP